MPERKRLAQNAAFLMGSDTLARIANVFFVIVAARLLGVDDYGMYATLMTFLLFGMMISQLGLQAVITRDVARHKERAHEYFSSALVISLPIAFVLWMLIPPFVVLCGFDRQIGRLLGLLGAALVGHAVARPAEGVLRAYEQMRLVSFLRVAISILTALLGIAALAAGYGIPTLLVVHVVSCWLEAALLTLGVHARAAPVTFKPSFVLARRAAADGILLLLLMLFDLTARRLDVLILARLASVHAVGLYVVCHRLLEYTAIFRTSAMGALFPFLASRLDEGLHTVAKGYNQALRLFAMYAIGIAVPLIFGASEIIRLSFGSEFLAAVSVLRILVVAMVAHALCGPVADVIVISQRRLPSLVGIVGLLSLLNVGLVIWFVPRLAEQGAALAALATSSVGLIARTWLVTRVLGSQKDSLISLLWRPAGAACASILCYVLFGQSHFWPALLPASVVYVAVLVMTGAFSREEIDIVKESSFRWFRVRGG
jgi:O-antigen/teichoic acid export membrane protein